MFRDKETARKCSVEGNCFRMNTPVEPDTAAGELTFQWSHMVPVLDRLRQQAHCTERHVVWVKLYYSATNRKVKKLKTNQNI